MSCPDVCMARSISTPDGDSTMALAPSPTCTQNTSGSSENQGALQLYSSGCGGYSHCDTRVPMDHQGWLAGQVSLSVLPLCALHATS